MDGGAAANGPPPGDEGGVYAHLIAMKLLHKPAYEYAVRLIEDGYDTVKAVDALSLEELKDDVGVKKGHLKAIERYRNPADDGAASPGPAAAAAVAPVAAAEPEPEPAPVPEGAPAGNAAAMSDRVLNFEARTGADLTPITGWQDKPLVSLGKSLEGVPVKDVQIHAEVAVEFGESYKLTHPAEKRSVDQLGKTRQPARHTAPLGRQITSAARPTNARRAVLSSCLADLHMAVVAERHAALHRPSLCEKEGMILI